MNRTFGSTSHNVSNSCDANSSLQGTSLVRITPKERSTKLDVFHLPGPWLIVGFWVQKRYGTWPSQWSRTCSSIVVSWRNGRSGCKTTSPVVLLAFVSIIQLWCCWCSDEISTTSSLFDFLMAFNLADQYGIARVHFITTSSFTWSDSLFVDSSVVCRVCG